MESPLDSNILLLDGIAGLLDLLVQAKHIPLLGELVHVNLVLVLVEHVVILHHILDASHQRLQGVVDRVHIFFQLGQLLDIVLWLTQVLCDHLELVLQVVRGLNAVAHVRIQDHLDDVSVLVQDQVADTNHLQHEQTAVNGGHGQ